MNMHIFLPHIYLLSLCLIAWRQLLEFNSQIVHFMIALPKPDNISHTCHQARIFNCIFNSLRSVYRERQNYNWWYIDSIHRWKTFPRPSSQKHDHCGSSALENFLVAGEPHLFNRCLVTLLLEVAFLLFFWHKFPEHTSWNGSLKHILDCLLKNTLRALPSILVKN